MPSYRMRRLIPATSHSRNIRPLVPLGAQYTGARRWKEPWSAWTRWRLSNADRPRPRGRSALRQDRRFVNARRGGIRLCP
jgi:hypothetical protein